MPLRFDKGDRVRVRSGWMLAGRTGTVLYLSDIHNQDTWLVELDEPFEVGRTGGKRWWLSDQQLEKIGNA